MPLAVIVAWPFLPTHVLERPPDRGEFPGGLSSPEPGTAGAPIDLAALGQVDVCVKGDSPSGRASTPVIGTRETFALTFTSPLALNGSTTLRTSGGMAFLSASSIGNDSALIRGRPRRRGPVSRSSRRD